MIEIRIHGRGGQGNVVAAYLLAAAAYAEGRHGQAFPNFGAERRGAPVTAFVRIAGEAIRRRSQVRSPAYLIIQDHALLHTPGVLDGLQDGGTILINSTMHGEEISNQLGREVISIPATKLAQEILGRPVPNTALLAAFLALTEMLPLSALDKALQARFRGSVLEKNLELIHRAADLVPKSLWRKEQPSPDDDTQGREPLEGSQAIARAVALCRPAVIAAYPITPQTHIVENISKLVADGALKTEFISVESEFSAASVVLGAAMAGSRAYTASASQGILLMAEVLYNIAGMRVPVVMTCANRAVSSPLSIWNDQQDSMAVRDAGWIQLYCEDNQEAVDTTMQAYKIAEQCELPVMVCMDGFTLTHTLEGIRVPDQATVDAYLPPFSFKRRLDTQRPTSAGTLVSPDFYSEARHSHHAALLKSSEVIIDADREWGEATGRSYQGLLSATVPHHEPAPEARKIGILALGSVVGTLREALACLPQDLPCAEGGLGGHWVKLIKLRAFRPFPVEAIQQACADLTHLIVLERALSPGGGGIVGLEVTAALHELEQAPKVFNYAVGLGGRDVPMEILPQLLASLEEDSNRFRIFDVALERLPPEDQ